MRRIRSPRGFALACVLLAVGCVMDIFSATVVVVPLLLPVSRAFGIDPLHFGVVFLLNVKVAQSLNR